MIQVLFLGEIICLFYNLGCQSFLENVSFVYDYTIAFLRVTFQNLKVVATIWQKCFVA